MNELLSENEQFCCFSSSSFNINNFYETKIDYLIILFKKNEINSINSIVLNTKCLFSILYIQDFIKLNLFVGKLLFI